MCVKYGDRDVEKSTPFLSHTHTHSLFPSLPLPFSLLFLSLALSLPSSLPPSPSHIHTHHTHTQTHECTISEAESACGRHKKIRFAPSKIGAKRPIPVTLSSPSTTSTFSYIQTKMYSHVANVHIGLTQTSFLCVCVCDLSSLHTVCTRTHCLHLPAGRGASAEHLESESQRES